MAELLKELKESLDEGEPDKETQRSFGYALYRNVEGSELEESSLGQKLMDLATDLAREKKS